MMSLTHEENISYKKQKKFVPYAKKNLVLMMTMKLHPIKSIIKSEILSLYWKILKQLLIIFVI